MARFSVLPATQTVAVNVAATITIAGTPPISGGQPFDVSDGGQGGTFSPVPPEIISSSQNSINFTYTNATPGIYTLTITPLTGGIYTFSGDPAQTVQVVVTGGSPPDPTGFSLTPGSRSGAIGQQVGPYVLTLLDSGVPAVAGAGGQAFALSSSDAQGVFSPGATVTVPEGQSSVSFTYASPNAGVATLTATASGSPYLVNTATAQAVISLPGAGSSGGRSMGPLIKANGMEFGEAYLWGTLATPDDTPFAKLQSLDFKVATGLKEAMGPEQYVAVGVGISDRKYTSDFTLETYSLQRYQLLFGGSAPTTVAAVVDPTTAPTLTAGSGSTAFTAGYIAVAYAYRTKWGTTKVSTIATVSVTSGQQIAVTSLGGLPSGVLSVDWYVSSQSYSTSQLAAAAALYKAVNNAGTGFNIVLYGLTNAVTVPLYSQVGAGGSVYAGYAYDEPVPFNIHCVNPADGSGRNLILYGAVCTDAANALKLREWTNEKITCNHYGDTSTTPAKMFEWYAPGTYLF